MKKYLYLLLMMIPVLGLMSCSNDGDELPDVTFHFETTGATEVDNVIYAVQGTTFEISSLSVTNNEAGKGAAISSASYYWDDYFVGTTFEVPFTCEFPLSSETALGRHQIQISCPVFAVDKELANALVTIDVEVVESEDDLPAVAEPATLTIVPTITKSGK